MAIARFPDLNWRRALAEVALIFVGITLALLFDNWNEARKERALERQLLSEVRDDLVETRADLETDIRNSERRLKIWRDLTAALVEEAPLDAGWAGQLLDTTGSSVLVAKTSGYRSLTSQGLGILSDPQVRKAITDFYELRVARLAHFESRTRDHLFGTYLSFIRDVTQIPDETLRHAVQNPGQLGRPDRVEPRDSQALKRNPETAHQFFDATGYTRATLRQYRQTLMEIDEVIRLIDAQLANPAGLQH